MTDKSDTIGVHVSEPRYEIKYAVNPGDYALVQRWVTSQPYLRQSYPSRSVHSVYLDSLNLVAALDNLSGVANRRKYRVRWYGDHAGQSKPPSFEVKEKMGRLGVKHTVPLGTTARALIRNPHEIAGLVHDRVASACSSIGGLKQLKPVLYVGYNRSYWEGPDNIRVTLDDNVRFADMLRGAKACSTNHVISEKCVIEFKFPPGSRDAAAEMMTSLPFSAVRNSKYLTGLSLFGHAVYI